MTEGRATAAAPASSADVATILRAVLAPCGRPLHSAAALGEVSAALAIARAGMAIGRYQPEWMRDLDRACEQLQVRITPVLRARALCRSLPLESMPQGLSKACAIVAQRVETHYNKELRRLAKWCDSRAGTHCFAVLLQSLDAAEKSKPLRFENTQILDCLSRHQRRLEKRRRHLLKRTRRPQVRAMGKAAQRLRWCQHFIALLGLPVSSEQHSVEVLRYREVLDNRRLARWCRRQLTAKSAKGHEGAVLGALWLRARQRRQGAERDLFVLAGAGQPETQQPRALRVRPELPLRLHFGGTHQRIA